MNHSKSNETTQTDELMCITNTSTNSNTKKNNEIINNNNNNSNSGHQRSFPQLSLNEVDLTIASNRYVTPEPISPTTVHCHTDLNDTLRKNTLLTYVSFVGIYL